MTLLLPERDEGCNPFFVLILEFNVRILDCLDGFPALACQLFAQKLIS